PVVGFFVNTLVLRHDLSGEPTFDDLVARARETVLGALAHQDLPFDRLVEIVNPERSLGRHPLFQVMVQHRKEAGGLDRLLGARTTLLPDPVHAARFDLAFTFVESADGDHTDLTVIYADDLFHRSTGRLFGARLLRVLETVATRPGTPVGELEVLDGRERDTLLRGWNATGREVPAGTVVDAFEARAAATPDDTAVVFGDRRLSYAELAGRVELTARHLAALGARPGRVVALALPRSAELVAALLGVLKSGAAYLPVDLDHPDERIALMLADAEPLVTLTTDEVARTRPVIAGHGLGTLTTGRLGALDADPVRPDPDDLAYVIHTSGSTGRPKGVQVPHRGLANMLEHHGGTVFARAERAAGGRRLRAAHTASFSFDSSWEQLLWLIRGHELHVYGEDLRRDPQALVARLLADRIDTLDVTPSFGRQLVEWGLLDSAEHRPLLFLVGGEAVGDALWSRIRDTEGVLGHNFYGPTEYTVDTLGAALDESPTPCVGRPIGNTRVYVLDARLRPVPAGVPGELYIAGEGLARGYGNRPG
ncbi:AMP-binding protein, partial [Kitasatospora sp. NPDC058263]